MKHKPDEDPSIFNADDEFAEVEDEEEDVAAADDDEEEDDDDELAIETFNATEAVGAFRQVFQFLQPYFAAYRSKLFLLSTGVLLEAAFNAAFPFCLKYLLDDALYEEDDEALEWILVVLGGLGLTVSVASVGYDYVNARLGATILGDIRKRIFERCQSLSASYYNRAKVGEVMSRFSTDLVEVEEAVMHLVSWGILPLLELITGTILLFVLNWKLAATAMLIFPISLIGSRYFSRQAIAASYQKKELEAATLSVVTENVIAQPVVKAFGLRGIAMMWFQLRNTPLVATATRAHFLNAMIERAVTVAVLMLHLIILGFGAYLVFHRMGLTIGSLVAFESVFWELSYNIGHVTGYVPTLIHASGGIRHINDLMEEPSQMADQPEAVALPRLANQIMFHNVDFSYTGEQRQLKQLSLTIPCGANVAIVGPSGSGKSTVLNLLLRFYEPSAGFISVDGYDLRDVTRDSWLAQTAVVFQESILFNTSIRENIRLGKPDATEQEIESAARAAEIHKFIKQLPHGYDTMVGERGTTLSGGQRQRLAIARAIIRNPSLLILDEATSALDHATEAAIAATLKKLARGRTVISITHRLNAVVDADTIFVLDQGKLVEVGTHSQLVARRGWYSRLWKQGNGLAQPQTTT